MAVPGEEGVVHSMPAVVVAVAVAGVFAGAVL